MNEKYYYTTDEKIQEMRTSLISNINKKKHDRRISKMLISDIFFVIIVISLVFTFIKVELDNEAGRIPNILGYQLLQVETGSMSPTFPIGSLIVNKIPKSSKEIEVSDIITYKHDEDIITHRVVEIVEEDDGLYYKTKGDNLENSIDPWNVYYDQVISVNKFRLPF